MMEFQATQRRQRQVIQDAAKQQLNVDFSGRLCGFSAASSAPATRNRCTFLAIFNSLSRFSGRQLAAL